MAGENHRSAEERALEERMQPDGNERAVGEGDFQRPKEDTVSARLLAAQTDATPFLRRAFMFLEDGDWKRADEYCEKALDESPENAQAYLGKLMAKLQVSACEQLKNLPEPFDGEPEYQKILRSGTNS